ncbi:MAG: endonuclease/exonuclease/phosphatase family protein [Bacteroidales bacterium]|nr:endonuclease/exonuclease/phosphatase family protein [Bacteroidales bacterium]
MKKSLFLFFVCAVFFSHAQNMSVATYNIRNKNTYDSINGNVWQIRSKVLCDQINFEQPAVFGAQEVLHEQLLDMLGLLDDYGYIGVGRDDGYQSGEYSAVFYKKDLVNKIDQGWFWLNESPDKPVKGWDAACVRICTWGKFRNKSDGFEFCFFTLHIDHVGVTARRESAKLIVKKIQEIAQGLPVIITGDFNVDQNDEIYSIFTESGLLKDSYVHARLRFAENGTFNSFNPELKTESRIDHIFVSPSFNVDNYAVMTDCYWVENERSNDNTLKGHDAPQQIDFKVFSKRTPSDHYPVFVKLKY